jgi:hypothetical protein
MDYVKLQLIPHEWFEVPLETFVAGEGPYTRALAGIFGVTSLPLSQLEGGCLEGPCEGYPLVLEALKRVVLVVPEEMAAADALRYHQFVWEWIVRLSSAADQHEAAFIFVLSENASEQYDEALAVGLSVGVTNLGTTGHAIWRRSGTLAELLELIASVRPVDLQLLMARRRVDGRRLVLNRLRLALTQDNPVVIRAAMHAVLEAFRSEEYHLDLFCRPPSHRHGNLLRKWLMIGVTGAVTRDWCATAMSQLTAWLIEQDTKVLP